MDTEGRRLLGRVASALRRPARLLAIGAVTLVLPGTAPAAPEAGGGTADASPASGPGDPIGWLGTVDANGVASGWTCDPDDFSRPLYVHFYVDGPAGSGTFIGYAYADQTREPAVGDFCAGWRNHGYTWQLPGWLWDGQWHRLYVHGISVGAGTHALLQGSGLWFRLGGGGSNPIGWLDVVDADGVAHGWTCDADDFSRPLYVHFYVDGSFVGDVYANVVREPAVGDFCGGWRGHGFWFALPESVRDGQWRTLSAWAIDVGGGSNVQLSGSPKGFALNPSLESEAFHWGDWRIESSPGDEVEGEPPERGGARAGDGADPGARRGEPEPDADGEADLEPEPAPEPEGEDDAAPDGSAGPGAGPEAAAETATAGLSSVLVAEPSPAPETDTAEPGASDTSPATTSTRCEWHNFEARWKQTRAYTVLTYGGTFRVCYVPNDRIVSITNMWGDASWVCGWCGWRWLGNASGYPTHLNFGSRAVLKYRGTVQFCPPHFWCIGTRQPWVEITFFPNGTKRQVIGVA